MLHNRLAGHVWSGQTLIFLVSHERINLDIDFDHPALSNPGRGSAAAPVRAEVGSGKAECDVESLIATE